METQMALNQLADSRDIKFILFELLEIDNITKSDKYTDFDKDIFEEIINLAETIAVEQVYPFTQEADKSGAVYNPETKEVVIPDVLKPGLDAYYEAGFAGINIEPEFGGMGMPFIIFQASLDYFACASIAFSMYPHLSLGAMGLVKKFGREEDKLVICEKIISGEWGGTMCLTEPEAGSDVGALKTKAEKINEDEYTISGQKIFISSGENDYYKNMIHPVLARVEGDPGGTKGISIFTTPKYRFDADGNIGEANDVVCSGIEHKMGIKASATCTLNFGDDNKCQGHLMGEQQQGMKIMFHMMNETRLYVGMQAASVSSTAYMHALTYAKNRIQGKDPLNPKGPDTAIINHPDVKRLLLSMKSKVEAMRTLVYFNTYLFDQSEILEGDEKKEVQALIEILIPIVKAGNTDTSWEVTGDAIQVYGGYGYCSDYPVEQFARDCKILSLYEGTNGIQSMDLAMRKLLMNKEQYNYSVFKKRIENTISNAKGIVDEKYISIMEKGILKLDEVVEKMKTRKDNNEFSEIFADATPLREIFVMITYAWMHLWAMTLVTPKAKDLAGDKQGEELNSFMEDNAEAAYYNGRLLSGKFYIGSEFQKFFGKVNCILDGDSAVADSMNAAFTGAPLE
jgi:alkylation response protein AidB-like acyl-CoA dehydrogenase